MLYIVGCSYSQDWQWPENINIEFKNYSIAGAGNKYVYASVDDINLTSDDKIIVQYSEADRIDIVIDHDSPWNSILDTIPSIQRVNLTDCVAWCTAGPRGAWNNTEQGKNELRYLMRELYSVHNQKIENRAWRSTINEIIETSGAQCLFLDIETMNQWAKDNNRLDDDDFHINKQGNLEYYNQFIRDFVEN